MAIRHIPEIVVFICDGCSAEQKADGEYQRRPKYWSTLRVERDAYDYQGCAVADGSIERMLCRECSTKLENAINQALNRKA